MLLEEEDNVKMHPSHILNNYTTITILYHSYRTIYGIPLNVTQCVGEYTDFSINPDPSSILE